MFYFYNHDIKKRNLSQIDYPDLIVDELTNYEEGLEYPYVHYPKLLGLFIGFSENINSEVYLCECSKKPLNNYIRLMNKEKLLGKYNENMLIPIINSKLNVTYNSDVTINDFIFKPNICHLCNNIKPHKYNCHFHDYWGWYHFQAYLRFGLHVFDNKYLRILEDNLNMENINYVNEIKTLFSILINIKENVSYQITDDVIREMRIYDYGNHIIDIIEKFVPITFKSREEFTIFLQKQLSYRNFGLATIFKVPNIYLLTIQKEKILSLGRNLKFLEFKPYQIVSVKLIQSVLNKLLFDLHSSDYRWKRGEMCAKYLNFDDKRIKKTFTKIETEISNNLQYYKRVTAPKKFILEKKLPYPFVQYSEKGAFIAFKKDENSKPVLCSCCKKAVENYKKFQIIKPKRKWGESSSLGKRYGFPKAIDINNIDFVPNICHRCNREYGTVGIEVNSKRVENFIWYSHLIELELGVVYWGSNFILLDNANKEITDLVNTINKYSKRMKFFISREESEILKNKKLECITDINNIIKKELNNYFDPVQLYHIGSFGQKQLYELIKEKFPNERILYNNRPDFLNGLELDIFLPDLNIAFEYQGRQHYEPIGFFGGQEALEDLQKRDSRKKEICKKRNIKLYIVDYNDDLSMYYVNNLLK